MLKRKTSFVIALSVALTSALSGCAGTAEQQKAVQTQALQESSNYQLADSPSSDSTTNSVKATITDKNKSTDTLTASLDINTANKNKFTNFPITSLAEGDLPLITTSDGSTQFIMKVTGLNTVDAYKNKPVQILKGETSLIVDIYRIDTSNGRQTRIAQGIPYITVTKLNSQNDKVAFCGYNKLTVFDLKQNKLMLTEELKSDSVKYFGWSPDGETIYTEHPNLPCGSIIKLNDKKLVHAYETDQKLYYTGFLDHKRFYGTQKLIIDEKKQKENNGKLDEYRTVIMSEDGAIVNELPAGIYRDSYGKSFLQVGLEGFGLYFYPDFEKPDNKIKQTDEFIYDAEFIYDGYTAFITKSPDVESNLFILTVSNQSGNAVALAEVSGSGLALSPDGKTGFLNSPALEQINFAEFIKSAGKEGITSKSSLAASEKPELEGIYMAIRGSMDVYFRNDILGDEDYSALEKYFINSSSPEQCAFSDMKYIFDEKHPGHYADFYSLDLHLTKLSFDGDRASASISGSCRNSFGSGMGLSHALELVKKDDKWYITGLSTFPNSSEYKKVKGMLKDFMKDMKAGKLFDGKLKGKEITLGQIQFWQLSDPHLADEVRYSNYCKVYLHVTEPEGNKLYKLVLDKKNYKNWTPKILDGERLAYLF